MDYRAVVHLSPQDGCEDRGSLGYDRSACCQVIHPDLVGRTVGGKRIPGVQARVVEQEKPAAVQLVGAGLGEYLDATESYLIVFGREWILVDEDLSNSLFCRQPLARSETINI